MGEFDYHKLVVHQREVTMKIYDIKAEQKNILKRSTDVREIIIR